MFTPSAGSRDSIVLCKKCTSGCCHFQKAHSFYFLSQCSTGGGQWFPAYALYWLKFFATVSKHLRVSNSAKEELCQLMVWGMQAIIKGKSGDRSVWYLLVTWHWQKTELGLKTVNLEPLNPPTITLHLPARSHVQKVPWPLDTVSSWGPIVQTWACGDHFTTKL